MLLLFFLAFIVLCSNISLQIVCVGAVLAVLLYWFSCRFLSYSFRRDLTILKKSLFIVGYIGVLLFEIVLANIAVMHMILSPKFHPSPVLVTFSVPLHSDYTRTMLANSITLTPGTITVGLEGNTYTVHCLDQSLAEGIDESRFIRMLKKLEA